MEGPRASLVHRRAGHRLDRHCRARSPEYYRRTARSATAYDVLFIADEAPTGSGRTGPWLGHRALGRRAGHRGHGQGISGGYVPLGAVVAAPPSSTLHCGLGTFSHGFTDSGNRCARRRAAGCCSYALADPRARSTRWRAKGQQLHARSASSPPASMIIARSAGWAELRRSGVCGRPGHLGAVPVSRLDLTCRCGAPERGVRSCPACRVPTTARVGEHIDMSRRSVITACGDLRPGRRCPADATLTEIEAHTLECAAPTRA